MERDLNFTVTDGRRDDSVRVNGGISEYAEAVSYTHLLQEGGNPASYCVRPRKLYGNLPRKRAAFSRE